MGRASRRKQERRTAVPITPAIAELLGERRRRQELALGRPVGPDDPVFPELAAMSDEEWDAGMIAFVREAGAGEDVVAAYRAVGRIVVPSVRSYLPVEDVAAWDEALAEHHRDHPDDPPSDLAALEAALEAGASAEARRLRRE